MSFGITVVGLGSGEMEQLPLGVYRHLKQQPLVWLRTKDHPVVAELEADGVHFESFDSVYESCDTFEAVYTEIVETLLTKSEELAITYAVPGHPFVAERTVELLIEKGADVTFLGGQSFLDAMFQALRIDPINGFQLLDATALDVERIQVTQHVLIGQVYDGFVAGDVKVQLMERYPDEHIVKLVTAAGTKRERVSEIPLYEMDRVAEVDNLTTLYVPPLTDETHLAREFSTLTHIIATLRGPDGCPWDKKQTHESLRKYLLEEAYELIEAIDAEDDDAIVEELGDVLLQVMLHAQIGADDGYFDIRDVIGSISEKMVRRHPHVFGDVTVRDANDVISNWNVIKQTEKGEKKKSQLDGVLMTQPGLMRAEQLQKKAATVGFEWDDVSGAFEKLEEELREWKERPEDETELGDVLFSIVNVARYYALNAEQALERTNQKFKRRFEYIEANGPIEDMTLEQMDRLWNEAKEQGL
ncbi:nucleoside triphosphate pyrophosphohydrolase [Exiguobacterium aurantiacum]|uniref:Nucleoside triphosphate pyrophosphohydrolase/pyrophosphatase MazG n=1 Tax=Exiguobacterium aurantiacum TaxID=33987 RepID=A0A377FPI5_9BACL|nr:nucleoside triphosphate pyrophosphohydrolase [Exiguobacterium aurantiacum]STO06759.1 Nucleoside triphosphate pyrophosphohydrolase/pyrophosphatase MazG [Exiguobacterium aurantiacum]